MGTGSPPFDPDWQLRLAAFAQLGLLAQRTGGVVTGAELDQGFEFQGERIRFWDPRRGIWRPRQLGASGAALTIVTAPPKPHKSPRYDDQVGSASGEFVYRYEGSDPDHWTNVAVRRAYLEGRPLIYLYGIVSGKYEALFPCVVTADVPAELAFHVMADRAADLAAPSGQAAEATADRAYATRDVKVRLHQRRFRELVVLAYAERCAMCRLTHGELLDAAHILPDKDERGRPEVPNGLCLCKIHHAAYDADIVGVAPDYRVHVRRDVLEEHDGPMLRHGLQELEDQAIVKPRSRALWPRAEYLEERLGRFKAA
jgi:putative restriction endonuclease